MTIQTVREMAEEWGAIPCASGTGRPALLMTEDQLNGLVRQVLSSRDAEVKRLTTERDAALNVADMNATSGAFTARMLENAAKDAERFKGLLDLAGNWQDGTNATVSLLQDDATRSCIVKVDNETFYYSTFREAIDKAIEGMKS